MFEAVMIYLYVVFGNLVDVAGFFAFAVGFFYFMILFFASVNADAKEVKEKYSSTNEYFAETMKKIKFWTGFKFILFAFVLNSFYPTTENIKYIIGGAVAWNTAEWVAGSPDAKRIPENVLKAMNKFLENADGISDAVNNVTKEVVDATKESVKEVTDATKEAVSDNVKNTSDNIVKSLEK